MHASRTAELVALLGAVPVIPVVTIEDPERAVPLAETLVGAGLPVIEVTLRTRRALEAVAAIAASVPRAVVAAGTVVAASQIGEAAEAGAQFLVTPGTPPRLAEALASAPLPAMPGCATVTEALALADRGFEVVKFFPAAASGGEAWLKAVAAPLPRLRFCPTGGIDAHNAAAYLALPNVACIGGSWVAPPSAIAAGDVAAIRRLALAAAGLRRG